MVLTPIETTYANYRFRSRLEARWAVFFDRLGIPWEYEIEGFDLSGVPQQQMPLLGKANWYLPDFWLPTQGSWVEVKPDQPTPVESERVQRLAIAAKREVVIVVGQPWVVAEGGSFESGGYDGKNSGYLYFADGQGCDSSYLLTACPFCGRVDWCFDGWAGRLGCKCPNEKKGVGDFARVQRAYLAARKARFEHGQTPTGTGGI